MNKTTSPIVQRAALQRRFTGRFASIGLSLSLALALGCESTTVRGSGGRDLTLMQPASQSIRRGDTNKVMITVMRDNIPSNVKLRFDDLPRGVRVIEGDRQMKGNEMMVNYTLHAANDADLVTNHRARVTAEVMDGMSATETLVITVRQ